MEGYTELNKGVFDSQLVCESRWETVAYTDYDVICITKDYKEAEDREAVEEFSEQYDLPINWERR